MNVCNFLTINKLFQLSLFQLYGFYRQVENEYGFYENAYGEGGKRYAFWAAKMALLQNTGIPWIMCEQFDAPDPVVSSVTPFPQKQQKMGCQEQSLCFFCFVLQSLPNSGIKFACNVISNSQNWS